jgi:hypothetical protein
MIRWLKGLWYKRQREIDMKYLWPACCVIAKDLAQAKEAFAVHALNDKAWLFLGNDLTKAIHELEMPHEEQ